MPQVVNLPSRGISVNFPDDATPEEIQEALDEYYPRNGADVAYDIATERNFHLKGMSLDDYEMLRGHEGKMAEGKGAWDKTMEAAGMFAEDIGSGLKAAYRAAKKGQYSPTPLGSLNMGRDIAVGGLTGTYDLGDVIHGIFEVEDAEDTYNRHLSENDLKDTPEARKDYRSRLTNDFKDFKKKMDRADFRQGIIDLAVVPEVAHASSYFLDASVPVTFGMGALAKAPAMAATKTAGRTVGQVVGGGFRQAGRAATVVGEVPEKVAGKLLGEGAEAATRGVTTLGGGLGVATGTVIPAAPAAAKAAGAILDVAGDVLESASRAAAEGGRKGTFARSAELAETTAGKNISELLARVETPLSYAGEAIKGAGAGMAIGGTLGGLAEGEEGFWHGIGIGGPLGIGGSLAGRAVGDAFGVRRAALSYDDAKKYLSSHRDAHYAIKALDKLSPADAAHLADSVMHMEQLGVKVTFHDDNVPPPALSPEKVARKSYSGVMVDESGVFINTDRVTESTGLHEAFHATAYAMERGKFLGEVQGMLLGKTDPVEGLIVRPGALSMENFAKFVESYAGMMESSAARLRVAGDEIGAAKLEVQSMEFRRKVAEGDLQHAVDEFGAFYWDAFVRGEEPKLFIGGEKDLVVNALNWAKKKASKAFMRDAQKAGLDFSQGTQAAFIRGKQRQFAIPEFDAAIRRLVKNGDMEVTHSVPVTGIPKAQAFALAKLHGAEHLFEVNDKGEPVRVKTIKEIETESKADVETALDAIEVLPDNVRRSEIVVDEKGRRKLVARNLSNEEKAVLLRTVRHMNNSQRQQLEAFVAGMDSPDGKPVYKVSYWKASGAGRGKRKPYGQFEVSERDALPYSLEMNATGGLYLRFVDMDSVNGNLLKARRLKVYKNLHSSHREAVAEFHSYLENLDSDSPIPSAEFFGGGEVGRLKRNLFYEALGTVPRKDDPPLHNMGREGYTPKRGRNFAFKNFRVERLGNVEDTGVRVKFGESAYERSIVNMLPDESPARFMPDEGGGTPVTPKDALGGKSEPGTVLPAITVISPELAARFMPAVNDPGYHTPEGKMAFPMLADRMKVGTFKTRSGKEYELRGGPDHPDIADNKGVVAWAVEGGPIATQLQTAINKTDGIGLVVLQDEAAVSGNKTFSEIMLDELRYDVANNKKAARSLNKRIKDAALWVRKWAKSKGKKKWLNFKPQNLDDLAAVSPEMSFELRGEVFRKVASIDYKRKTGGIFWRDVMREVTAYQNKDGYRTGDIVKVIQFDKGESIVDPTEVGTPVHPSYRLAVKGRSISNVKGRLSAYQVFRDAFDSMEKEKPGRGITSKGKIGKSAFRSMQMRSLTDPIFREDVGGQTLDVKAYDQPLEFAAKSGPERAEIAKRSEVNQELGARFMPDDSAYVEAANRGDTDSAQRMVDQAAKAAGYTIGPVYHGGKEGITTFDPMAATSRADSGRYGLDVTYFSTQAEAKGYGGRYGEPSDIYKVHLKIDHPYVINDLRTDFHTARMMGDGTAAENLKAAGYDGIYEPKAEYMGSTRPIWAVFGDSPSQIKSADPITRDDAGNVIPLSERFQSSSDDIRFMPDASVPGAEKNSIGWSMLLTKAGNWRVYGPDGVLAGVAGSKQRAEQIFKTKYKRELRKRERSSSVRYMPDAGRPPKKNRKWKVLHGELDDHGSLMAHDQTDHPTLKSAISSISDWEKVTRYRRGNSWIYKGENVHGEKLAAEVRKSDDY